MDTKTNNQNIPLVYAYLYMKIKKQLRGGRIAGSNLRKIIQKTILCDKDGGNKGVPRRYCYDIIKDLIDLKLIEKIGKVGNNPTYGDTDKNVSEIIERLKDWKINEKLRNDKDIKKQFKNILNILDEDPLYRVVKSQCDKQLKQAFW